MGELYNVQNLCTFYKFSHIHELYKFNISLNGPQNVAFKFPIIQPKFPCHLIPDKQLRGNKQTKVVCNN